jgi:predicted transcriptional regulator of viral defense system
MSTDRKTSKTGRSQTLHRFAQLATMGEMVFHCSDLASLWQITNRNTLHTTLKRYTKQKLLYRLWQGMYALKPADQIDPLFLGIKAVHSYSYISTETILFRSGVISQRPSAITLVSSTSRRFTVAGGEYSCRKLADSYLYQSDGISEQNGVREASPERAVADLLYYNPRAYFDAPLNWKEVRRIQKAVGYPLTPHRYQ